MRASDLALPASVFRLRLWCLVASGVWLLAMLGVVWYAAAERVPLADLKVGWWVSLGAAPVVGGLWCLCLAADRRLRRRARQVALCPFCDYPLEGRRGRCPECGGTFTSEQLREVWGRAER